ncbi:MAG: transforming growth factor-beta-induced protein [Sphingobacteriales bacterium]|jgi:transforming growth factor-beta-induced protein
MKKSIVVLMSVVTLFFAQAQDEKVEFTTTQNISQNLSSAQNLTTLVTLLKFAELQNVLATSGPFTIIAPTNSAFDKLPSNTMKVLSQASAKDQLTGILKYHVIPGSLSTSDLKDGDVLKTINGETISVKKFGKKLYFNNSLVSESDAFCSNGVVHFVNDVQLPPLSTKGTIVGGAAMSPAKNVMENVRKAPNLSTLVTALEAVNMDGGLEAVGPITVFAPTNSGFEQLGDKVTQLLTPEGQTELRQVLSYHVVSGKFTINELKNGAKLKTVNGQKLVVSKKDGNVYINGALVVTRNIDSSNGRFHIIDTVLLPEAKK